MAGCGHQDRGGPERVSNNTALVVILIAFLVFLAFVTWIALK